MFDFGEDRFWREHRAERRERMLRFFVLCALVVGLTLVLLDAARGLRCRPGEELHCSTEGGALCECRKAAP